MSKYTEITEWMFGQIPTFQNVGAAGYKPGLDNVLRLSEAFGNPHLKLRTIHVAGTNGKGSTSSLLASVLQTNALKTGLFTSPHLVDFRERIRINGVMIPEQDVVDFIERYRNLNLNFEPSFFELTTVMAFDWFARSDVDIAVIETGLGGRLDSTNIITPLLSVITNISLDHTALLGHTEPEIAREKAGIIKPGVPVVIGRADGDVRRVFEDTAHNCGSQIYFAEDYRLYSTIEHNNYTDMDVYTGTPWGYTGSFACPLTGDCQHENVNTVMHALQTLEASGMTISPGAVVRGMELVRKNTGLTGRWTTLRHDPHVICDTGHNPGGWQWLAPQLTRIADRETLNMVIGFVGDKDVSGILKMMPRKANYYFTSPSVKRGLPATDLAAAAAQCGLQGTVYQYVAEAYNAALHDSQCRGTVFIGGSTFVVADLLRAIGPQDTCR